MNSFHIFRLGMHAFKTEQKFIENVAALQLN